MCTDLVDLASRVFSATAVTLLKRVPMSRTSWSGPLAREPEAQQLERCRVTPIGSALDVGTVGRLPGVGGQGRAVRPCKGPSRAPHGVEHQA